MEQALQAYRVHRADTGAVERDPVPPTTNQGLVFSLLLHELGTHAAKYGARSNSEGRVHVWWQTENGAKDHRVRLRWEEEGGVRSSLPGRKGFGTRLIERACTHELVGEVELDHAPSGLRCEAAFPLS